MKHIIGFAIFSFIVVFLLIPVSTVLLFTKKLTIKNLKKAYYILFK